MPETKTYYIGPVPDVDDFGDAIATAIGAEIIDGPTIYGPWALMTPFSFRLHGLGHGRLGLGLGQKYVQQSDGRWLKVEG